LVYDPERYAANKEAHAEYGRRFRAKYPEEQKLRRKIYRAANLERHADYERKRRAAKREQPQDSYTTKMIIEMWGTVCHICGNEIDMNAARRPGRKGWEQGLHLDHLVPIGNGGSDTMGNVKPAHGLCNLQKARFAKNNQLQGA
jgi:5-methylcytosine-specific restriction endonuclease McrA